MVDKYGCMEYVKLKHQVEEAVWSEEEGKWKLKVGTCHSTVAQTSADSTQVEDLASNNVLSDQCDMLLSATGSLNNWKWPSIPGLHDFKGKLMHSASWDTSYDYSVCQPAIYRRVGLISCRARELLSSEMGPAVSKSFLGCCQTSSISTIMSAAGHGFLPRLLVMRLINGVQR